MSIRSHYRYDAAFAGLCSPLTVDHIAAALSFSEREDDSHPIIMKLYYDVVKTRDYTATPQSAVIHHIEPYLFSVFGVTT